MMLPTRLHHITSREHESHHCTLSLFSTFNSDTVFPTNLSKITLFSHDNTYITWYVTCHTIPTQHDMLTFPCIISRSLPIKYAIVDAIRSTNSGHTNGSIIDFDIYHNIC